MFPCVKHNRQTHSYTNKDDIANISKETRAHTHNTLFKKKTVLMDSEIIHTHHTHNTHS